MYGRRFDFCSDNSALKALLGGRQKGIKPMHLLRWSNRLHQHDFEVLCRPGEENIVADMLSQSSDNDDTEEIDTVL